MTEYESKNVLDWLGATSITGVSQKTSRLIFKTIENNKDLYKKDIAENLYQAVITVFKKSDALVKAELQNSQIYKKIVSIQANFKDTENLKRCDRYQDWIENINLIALGLSPTLCEAVKRKYQSKQNKASEYLKSNPYKAYEDITGFSFIMAESIAYRVGLSKHKPERLSACLLETFKKTASAKGSTAIDKKVLLSHSLILANTNLKIEDQNQKKLKVPVCETELKSVYDLDLISKKLLEYDIDNHILVTSSLAAKLEAEIAKDFSLRTYMARTIPDIDIKILKAEKDLKIKLDDSQKEAVKIMATQNICVMTGGPGTGKTTSLKVLLKILEPEKSTIRLCAPTGKAASVMTVKTGHSASTIHSLLRVAVDSKGNNISLRHSYYEEYDNDPYCISRASLIIIDEVSMVDINLLGQLSSHINQDCRIVLIGDPGQLPSIGPGKILADMILSGTIPKIELKQSHRQILNSPVYKASASIRNGKRPADDLSEDGKDEHYRFISSKNDEETSKLIQQLVQTIPEVQSYMVLTPVRKGLSGTLSLNQTLSELLCKGKDYVSAERSEFYAEWNWKIGDKAMHRVNNRMLGLMNGMIGNVINISTKENSVSVLYPDTGQTIVYDPRSQSCNFRSLIPAHAITVHKSQGSEYDHIILAIPHWKLPMIDQALLNTAVTRARKSVVVIGSNTNYQDSIDNIHYIERKTLLENYLNAA